MKFGGNPKGREVSPEELERFKKEIDQETVRMNDAPSKVYLGKWAAYEHPFFEGMYCLIAEEDTNHWGWAWVKLPRSGWCDAPDQFFEVTDGWRYYGPLTVKQGEPNRCDKNGLFVIDDYDGDDESMEAAPFGPLNWKDTPSGMDLVPSRWKAGDIIYPVLFHSNNAGGFTMMDKDGNKEYWQAF